jgi:hypothetical protein
MARAVEANRTLLAARTARAIDAAGIEAAGTAEPEVSFEAARETPHWAFTGPSPWSCRASGSVASTSRTPRSR